MNKGKIENFFCSNCMGKRKHFIRRERSSTRYCKGGGDELAFVKTKLTRQIIAGTGNIGASFRAEQELVNKSEVFLTLRKVDKFLVQLQVF